MFRSLFLFDVTFWLYLAAVALYFSCLVASKKALRPAYAGHPASFEEDDGWAQEFGQLATWVTFFGLIVNGVALGMRAYERMQLSGTFAPWSNQFEAMSYASSPTIAGYLFLEIKYGIKAIGAFVVSVGFIAMGAASLLPYRYQVAEPLVPALNSYLIYIHVSVTLTSYPAFAMAGGLGVMYLLKERAERQGRSVTIYDTFPSLGKVDDLGDQPFMIGFSQLAFRFILSPMWANYA